MHLLEVVNIIKARREELDVTQEQLAELAEVGLRTVKSLESGKANPTFGTLFKIAEVLGLEIQLVVKK